MNFGPMTAAIKAMNAIGAMKSPTATLMPPPSLFSKAANLSLPLTSRAVRLSLNLASRPVSRPLKASSRPPNPETFPVG